MANLLKLNFLLFLFNPHTDADQLLYNHSAHAEKVRVTKHKVLRTVLVSAGRRAMFAALKPVGLPAFRGGLGEVLRAVQTLHDLVHVVIAGLHRLTLQGKLILHILHHLNRNPLALVKCHH